MSKTVFILGAGASIAHSKGKFPSYNSFFSQIKNLNLINYKNIDDKNLIDYSDGSNGSPYDQNDWAHFYLPTFEIEANAVEDPIIEPPGKERLINETVEPIQGDWILDENLTKTYTSVFSEIANINNMDVEYRVYMFGNDSIIQNEQPIIKVFARPDVFPTYAEWSLITEGKITEDKEIELYSQQALIDTVHP